MVIYEWKDSPYLGKVTSKVDDYLPVSRHAGLLRIPSILMSTT